MIERPATHAETPVCHEEPAGPVTSALTPLEDALIGSVTASIGRASEDARRAADLQHAATRSGFDAVVEEFRGIRGDMSQDRKATQTSTYRLMVLLIAGLLGMGGLNVAYQIGDMRVTVSQPETVEVSP